MSLLPKLLIVFVALIHGGILWLEMFAWTSRGPKVFRMLPAHLFNPTKAMAANQGLYNGFLAAGLLWTLFIADPVWQRHIAVVFLSFVAIAGTFGALTISKRIFFVQTVPALLAWAALVLA